MSSTPFQNSSDLPPEITFVSLPKALAQFHHLPTHVPLWIHQQPKMEEKGYDFNEGVGAMEELLHQAPNAPGNYLFQLFVKKWPKLLEINVYFESKRIAEAIPKLVEILDIDPECPLTCFQLGYCFRVTGELEKSESFYKQALRMAPDAGWIYSNLGRTYQAMGENRKASETYWRAFELMPGDHFVLEQLMALGEMFALPQEGKDGEPVTAFIRREDYERKMEEVVMREKNPNNLLGVGWRMLQDRLNDLARHCFETAYELDKGLTEALLGMGTVNLNGGRYPEAERFLSEYLDENPQSAVAHLNLFKVYLAQDELDLAWDEIQTTVRLEPNRVEAVRQLFALFRQTDRLEEGFECLDQLAEENPGGFVPLLVKAQALAEDNQWPEAQLVLQEAMKRAPHNEELLLFYTAEMGKRGQSPEVVHLLQGEPQQLPLSLTINLAMAYSRTGKLDKAKSLLEAFLQRPSLSRLDQGRIQVLLKEFKGDSLRGD